MSLTTQVNAVKRSTTPKGRKHLVELVQFFPSEPAAVWDALTSPDAMSQWFDNLEGSLKEGGRYRLALSRHHGRIRDCIPHEKLSVTWEYDGSFSSLRITMSPSGRGTKLKVSHEVLADEHWDTFGPSATGIGWDGALYSLSLYLQGDLLSNPDNMAAHMATPEGLQFITDLAESWKRAHNYAGANHKIAELQAARTAAFYRGEKPPEAP